MAEIKRAYLMGKEAESSVVNKLLRRADAELTGPVYTIVNKELVPPSGSKNDYMTVGPYWWPDPEKEDGLPWIRRDGEVNPVAQGELADRIVASNFARALTLQTYAAYFSGEERYAERADALMQAWFVDPATRMNPNLDYAQGIPGLTEGRCYGIIEWTMVMDLVTDLELLKATGLANDGTIAAGSRWLADYLGWLQTSKLGIEEGATHNNHGTWYDVQLMTIMLHLDRRDAARMVAEGVKARIDGQIAADGSQPHELERTKSLSYSTMNLHGFTELAALARKVDVDLWIYRTPQGAGIPTAYAFLQPYALGKLPWTMPQLTDPAEVLVRTKKIFGQAGSLFGEDGYCKVADRATEAVTLDELLYPCVPKD